MAYNEQLANRVREKLANLTNIEEKQMFGGLAFMYNGKMCVGIVKDELMCRVDPDLHDQLVEMQGCRTMDFTHRPMKGFVYVEESGMHTNADLDYWINLALEFNDRAKSSKKSKSASKKH